MGFILHCFTKIDLKSSTSWNTNPFVFLRKADPRRNWLLSIQIAKAVRKSKVTNISRNPKLTQNSFEVKYQGFSIFVWSLFCFFDLPKEQNINPSHPRFGRALARLRTDCRAKCALDAHEFLQRAQEKAGPNQGQCFLNQTWIKHADLKPVVEYLTTASAD